MNREQKSIYIESLKQCIKKSKGYAIIEFYAKDVVVQKYRRILNKKGVIVKKIKLKLLTRVLEVPKDMFYGQIYLIIMNDVLSLHEFYLIHHELKYSTMYKLGEFISSSYVIKPQLLAIRPTKLFKNIEQRLPLKLTRGFIEVLDNIIFTKDEVVDLMFDSLQKELNLLPKLVYAKVLNYVLKNSADIAVDKLNDVIMHIDNLPQYIYYENGLNNFFNPQIYTLDYAHYEFIKSYIPVDVKILRELAAYGPAELISKYNIVPKTKQWTKSNLTTLLYLLCLSIHDSKSYPDLGPVFTDESSFNQVISYYSCVDTSSLFSLFNKIYTTSKQLGGVKDTAKKVNTEEFDDLF